MLYHICLKIEDCAVGIILYSGKSGIRQEYTNKRIILNASTEAGSESNAEIFCHHAAGQNSVNVAKFK
jgi:hypothetical protein